MSKKILLTGTELHLHQFWVPHIKNFINNGYDVDIICSVVSNKLDVLKYKLGDLPVTVDVIDLSRSPFKLSNINGYRQIKKILSQRSYDTIITNEPVMGAITRLAAKKYRKKGTKVLYTSHGFHFFTGAPKLNWMIFYPIEKMLAHYTDALVTINSEDFDRANNKFKAKKIFYIHGIGVDSTRLDLDDDVDIRNECGIDDDAFVILSIGELNANKNHEIVIRALGRVRDPKIHYLICGKGELLAHLKSVAYECEVLDNVHFLGYRTDIVNFFRKSDVLVFPSYREGLGIAPLEALYCGLPVIASRIRGPIDFIQEGENGYTFECDNSLDLLDKIIVIRNEIKKGRDYSTNCKLSMEKYSIDNVKNELVNILKNI